MKEEAYWVVHDLLVEIAEYEGLDLEETEYEEHGVYPKSIHATKQDHKEAIRLLSQIYQEELELGFSELETWKEDYENSKWAGRYGRTEYDEEFWDNPVEK